METMAQIEELLDLIFKTREKITRTDFDTIIENESSDLLVNMLSVIRDCLPCTQSFWENRKKFYKSQGRDSHASPSRTVPGTKYNPSMTGSSSPKARSVAAVGGETGANMLRNAALRAKEEASSVSGTEPIPTESDFKELEFNDENMKMMAEGFAKNADRFDHMKEKMYEPGSPKFTPAVRLPNHATSGTSSL